MDAEPPPRLSTAAAQEELRLAKLELKRWQSAYDHYQGNDPRKYHSEIRSAEQRIVAARQKLREMRKV